MLRAQLPTESGDATERFGQLFVEAEPEILKYIRALVPNINDAQEILQEAAIDLWRKFDQYDPAYPFTPWACRFAFLRVLKHRAQRARRVKCLGIESLTRMPVEPSTEDLSPAERQRALEACVQQLGEADRLLVEHRYSRQMPVAQIALITGRNAPTLYKALERIRRRLHFCVNQRLELGSHC
jgi:RNA polymerase sigma-70 factor, ECF subfamily